MKKILALMIMATILVMIPRNVDAADVPAKVTRALKRAVDENGRAIIVDQKAGKMYLFKRNKKTGDWEHKRTCNCIVADRLSKTRHYVLMRNDDADLMLWGEDYVRWSYGMVVDSYERPEYILIHSYTERYTGRRWVKDKSPEGNTFGIATCEENARYIWRYYGDGTAVMGC